MRRKKKISDKLLYDPQLNFNIVKNKVDDFDTLEQYKHKGAKIEEKDVEAKRSKIKPRTIRNSPDLSTSNEPTNSQLSSYME